MTRWIPETVEERLWRRSVIDENRCYVWTGQLLPNGYGRVSTPEGKHLVHRVAHELFIGPIPEGYEVDHVYDRGCRSLACWNPAHLEAVTPLENTRRAVGGNARKTRCINGHVFTEANTRLVDRGDGKTTRACRRCDADRAIAYRARKAA